MIGTMLKKEKKKETREEGREGGRVRERERERTAKIIHSYLALWKRNLGF